MNNVDDLIEKQFPKQRAKSVEKKHNLLLGMEKLFSKLTVAAFAKSVLNKQHKESKLNMKDILLHKKTNKTLNKHIKIPTLEDIEKRRRRLPKLPKKINKSINLSDIISQKIRRILNTDKEEYVVKDYNQICTAADRLAIAFVQGNGNEMLEKYRDCFKSRNKRTGSASSLSSKRNLNRIVNQGIAKARILFTKKSQIII